MRAHGDRFLAFDLGASSGRALLGTLEGDRIEIEELHRFETPLIEEGARLYWDLREIEHEVDEGLARALERNPRPRSVSVDSWAVDYVPLDRSGVPLRNPYSYRDPRTQQVMDEALEQVAPEQIYSTIGIQFMPINTLYQVLADLRAEPELVERTAVRFPIADYLNYRFSGREVVELSMASTTQLMNVRTRKWDVDLMSRFGIDPGTWPRIVPPATRLGPLRRTFDWPDLNGSASDIEVIAGCSHDTACAVAAVPASDDDPPWAYVSCGTWALLGVERREPILNHAAYEAGFTNELGLDGTVRFLKNLMGLWMMQECERAWREEGQRFDHDLLQREALESSAKAMLDLDDSRFAERGSMPRKILDACRESGQPPPETRGDFVRIILKSMVSDFRGKLDVLETLAEERIDRIYMVGGGSQNELLCQWTADETGRRVTSGPAEATSFGNLLIQARTLGSLPAGVSIRDVVRASCDLRTYEPE